MSAIISDLSNGLESKKVPVFLDFKFDYITAMEIAPKFKRMLKAAAAENEKPQNSPEMLEFAHLDFQIFNAGSRKGWGLRAAQKIGQSDLALFEYAGVLKMVEAYQEGEEDEYFFGFEYNGHHFLVDANAKGNLARFCNHSCEPNCYTRLAITDGGMPHLLICTKRPIKKEEELTLDYGDIWWKAKSTLNCACGSGICKYNGKEDEDVRFNDEEEDNIANRVMTRKSVSSPNVGKPRKQISYKTFWFQKRQRKLNAGAPLKHICHKRISDKKTTKKRNADKPMKQISYKRISDKKTTGKRNADKPMKQISYKRISDKKTTGKRNADKPMKQISYKRISDKKTTGKLNAGKTLKQISYKRISDKKTTGKLNAGKTLKHICHKRISDKKTTGKRNVGRPMKQISYKRISNKKSTERNSGKPMKQISYKSIPAMKKATKKRNVGKSMKQISYKKVDDNDMKKKIKGKPIKQICYKKIPGSGIKKTIRKRNVGRPIKQICYKTIPGSGMKKTARKSSSLIFNLVEEENVAMARKSSMT